MERESTNSGGLHRPHANAALLISIVSVVWTVVSSSTAIALGVRDSTAVLIAFGGVGFVDAVGSVALVYHFHHGLRHDELSDEIEKVAHRVVLIGLMTVGAAALVGGLLRLVTTQSAHASTAGMALAAASLVVLTVLSIRKSAIGTRVASAALVSDGHLSGIGAAQALVALMGTGVERALGWDWADAAATSMLGCVAIAVGVQTLRAETRYEADSSNARRIANPSTDSGKGQRPRP